MAVTVSAASATPSPASRASAPYAKRFSPASSRFGLFVLFVGLKTDQNIRNELIIVPRWGLLAIVVVLRRSLPYVAYGRPLHGVRRCQCRHRPVAGSVARGSSAADSSRHRDGGAGRAGSACRARAWPPAICSSASLAIIYALACVIFYFRAFIACNFTARDHRWCSIRSSSLLCVSLGVAGLAEMYRQFRHPDPDLRDARLGAEHRRRPRRPARPRLCRLLCGRRLFLRAALQHFGLSFWILLPLAGILAAFWGVILGFPVLRLRGDYLAIVTLAFGEIIRLVLINWREVTNGSAGISGIPKATFFGLMSFNVGATELLRQGASALADVLAPTTRSSCSI